METPQDKKVSHRFDLGYLLILIPIIAFLDLIAMWAILIFCMDMPESELAQWYADTSVSLWCAWPILSIVGVIGSIIVIIFKKSKAAIVALLVASIQMIVCGFFWLGVLGM